MIGECILENSFSCLFSNELIDSSLCFVICDSTVAGLHLEMVVKAISSCKPSLVIDEHDDPLMASLLIVKVILPSIGEHLKSLDYSFYLQNTIFKFHPSRLTLLVALGGGVVCDLVGFVASNIMRGLRLVLVPTTLLAMVDASIGAKCGVNYLAKNSIGSFYKPTAIITDIMFLNTLPKDQIRNGVAEIIKIAILKSPVFLNLLFSSVALDAFYNDKKLLLEIVEQAIALKYEIVNEDLHENGLRCILNLGHTVGHAIEKLLGIMHGEAVAIGCVVEAAVACYQGICSFDLVNRMASIFAFHNLPYSWNGLFDEICQVMKLDKKNNSHVRFSLVRDVGFPINVPVKVPLNVLEFVLSSNINVCPKYNCLDIEVNVPGSKSITNRALLLAALGHGSVLLENVLFCEDVSVMLNALVQLGMCRLTSCNGDLLIEGGGGIISNGGCVHLKNSGTSVRFLTASLTLCQKEIIIDGSERMRNRPISSLVNCLISNGCKIEYNGHLPLKIKPGKLRGGHLVLDASTSSQFASALLICAPYASTPVTLELSACTSIQYIEMTIQMMAEFGILVTKHGNVYNVPLGTYTNPTKYVIETDATAATYAFAVAALTKSTVSVRNMSILQGDYSFAQVLKEMNCNVVVKDNLITVSGTEHLKKLKEINMNRMTDSFITLAVLSAMAQGESTIISGIYNQNFKESDRIKVVCKELSKFNGVEAKEYGDGLIINGRISGSASIDTYKDHRIAMAFSCIGTKYPVIIEDKGCVEKTWPLYWRFLADFTILSAFKLERFSEPIILIGMRGVGKTTLGRAVAGLINLDFIDTDEVLVETLGNLNDYIKTHGWELFRIQEYNVLIKVTMKKNCLVSCGGGIVEFEASRVHLKQFANVIYINRDECALNDEPPYEMPFIKTWNYRKPYYEMCSTYEYYFDEFNRHLFASFLTKKQVVFEHRRFHILSLTFPKYTQLEIQKIKLILAGVNAVELRVDLLESIDGAKKAYFLLKKHLDVPVIFTMRNPSFELLLYAIKWKVDVLDVDMNITFQQQHQLQQLANDANLLLIGSFHDHLDELPWTENNSIWLEIAEKAVRLKYKVVKLVGNHQSNVRSLIAFQDKLEKHIENTSACLQMQTPLLITFCMGPKARATRLHNMISFITHPDIPSAAPGQYTIKQFNQALFHLGEIEELNFYLLGDPIEHSMSPRLHNHIFQTLGLPYTYSLHNCCEISNVLDLISSESFGGASITMPLKEKMFEHALNMFTLSPVAMAVRAVNTLYKTKSGIIADNTDVKGIAITLKSMLGNQTDLDFAVLGAGGTARAALYALKNELNMGKGYIFNRTLQRAKDLANEYSDVEAFDFDSVIDDNVKVVVCTIPAEAQEFINFSNFMKVPLIAIDLNYKDSLFQQHTKCINGLGVFIEQGIQQGELWTQVTSLRRVAHEFFKR